MSEVDFLDTPPPVPQREQQQVLGRGASIAPLALMAIPGIGPLLAAVGLSATGGKRQRGLNDNALIREANARQQTLGQAGRDPSALEDAAVTQRGRGRRESIERAGLLRERTTRQTAIEKAATDARLASEKVERDAVVADRTFFRTAREGLVNDVAPALGDLRSLNTALRTVLTANEDFAGDQAMVFNFARAITGGGGQSLSDKDVARLGGSGALGESVRRWLGEIDAGRTLTPSDRKAIRQQMVQAYRQAREEIKLSQGPAIATAERIGLSQNELFGEGVFINDDTLRQALGGGGFDALPLAPVVGAGARPGVTSTVDPDGTIVVESN
jgi:hypothetical protein